ncbi:MAG: DUF4381 domain-containing protein [Planctomycetota bacterium]|jgi:hypothetical protein
MMEPAFICIFKCCILPALAAGQEGDPASLDNLHDIVTPAPVSWWPLAPGWYVLALLILLTLGWSAWTWYRRRRTNAYRRAALLEFEALSRQTGSAHEREDALRKLPELLKRTALAAWPRAEVAELTGREWLAFLDRTAGMKKFSEGKGRILPELAYGGSKFFQALKDEEVRSVIGLAERWIREHRVSESGQSG